MPGGGDPRRAVDVRPDVALVRHSGVAGVEAHAHADGRPSSSCASRGRLERPGRRRERDEERVALRVDLDAAVPRERLAQNPPVLGERARVPSGPSSCSSRVDPSMSVKRNVTVPVGSSATGLSLRRYAEHVRTPASAWFAAAIVAGVSVPTST